MGMTANPTFIAQHIQGKDTLGKGFKKEFKCVNEKKFFLNNRLTNVFKNKTKHQVFVILKTISLQNFCFC